MSTDLAEPSIGYVEVRQAFLEREGATNSTTAGLYVCAGPDGCGAVVFELDPHQEFHRSLARGAVRADGAR